MFENFSKAKNIYFIGIGGIGISAVARLMISQGKNVYGSDRGESKVTTELEKIGAKIFIGHSENNIPANIDLVIYTVAIPHDNPEFIELKKRGVPTYSYPESLEYVCRDGYVLAVSGTHGKTTTTAMLAHILIKAGLDPSVIVGSLMKNPDAVNNESNFIIGKSKYLVIEADEYKKSFHHLTPNILIVNNLDLDHLDFYKDLKDIQDSFIFLINKIPEGGHVILDKENKNIAPLIEAANLKKLHVHDYSSLRNRPEYSQIKLKVPGSHNICNALASATAARVLKIPDNLIMSSLAEFDGLWRRFEFKGVALTGARVYDDYAHNPQKVRALISGAKEFFPNERLIIVFQPHLYSRTRLLFTEFTESFFGADEVILAPIFAAREKFDPTVSSETLAEGLIRKGVNAKSLTSFEEIIDYLKKNTGKTDVIITVGAGEGYKIADAIVKA